MKNLFKKQNTKMDFTNLSAIVTSGSAAGIAIANHLNKNQQTGGIIGVGLSLLVTGLLVALDDEKFPSDSKS
ncbi:hypothetical protein [Flavobacterium sp. SLB02]|uniref:hypothetical protein n=1 Tax=Flavobacterium sp. SLB02 TaxID=2665645 RepID=UPI0012A89096|nr:hypothetical protein [Flavobacterium sp. SLB02]QGK73163.1 hypothetical protein GIY83_03520 [Flavobacterium sp. SLB02]